MKRSIHALMPAAILTAALISAPVMAQTTAPAQAQPPAPMQAPPAINPTDKQLKSYAAASEKVSQVVAQYRPKLDAAKDDNTRQKIVKEADDKMVQLVRNDGLTVDEFNGIGQAVQQNPELKQRLLSMNKGNGMTQ